MNLATLPGLTELQQPTATAVNQACVKFGAQGSGYTADANGTPQQRLFYSCRVMVQTANKLAGSGGTANSLNIPNDELRTGVQAISPVQMNAQKQMNVEASKMSLVASRLLDLRGGTRGMVVGTNSQAPQSTVAASSRTAGLAGATGGGASADDVMGGKWGGFVNLGYSWGDVDQTNLQDAYKYDSFNVLLGADYRVSDAFVLGGAISYSDTKSDYEQSLGDVKARTTGVAAYGTYYVDNWYVDGFVAYGHVDYDSTRNIFIPSNNPAVPAINASATASPKGDQWSISIGVGRNFDSGALIITPMARLGYIWVKNEAFSESEPVNGLGLSVDSRTIQSLQSALGGKLSTNINTTTGVFGPYFSAYWMHEFENDTPSIVSKYVNDPFNTIFAIPTANPTRDYAVVTLGSTGTFPNNFSGFLHFSAALGLEDATNYAVVLGVRKQF
ncbi:MAG: autotransporter outer membrane beta-barrel domain-containing protein [Burkholderiales bacterium]